MTVEQRLKAMLGEAQFTLAVMATQLEEANKKLREYGDKATDVPIARTTVNKENSFK